MFLSKVIKTEHIEQPVIRSFSLKNLSESNSPDNGNNSCKNTCSDSQSKADLLLKNAKMEADRIIKEAQNSASNIKKEGYNAGYSKGLDDATHKVEQEFSTLSESLKNLCSEFGKKRDLFCEEHENIIIELALKIARKIIHQEVTANPDLIVGVLRAAIVHALNRERLKIRINPDDLLLCTKRKPEIIRDIEGIKNIEFEPDENIGKGGAIVEYEFGEIDARLEQQFKEVETEVNKISLNREYVN